MKSFVKVDPLYPSPIKNKILFWSAISKPSVLAKLDIGNPKASKVMSYLRRPELPKACGLRHATGFGPFTDFRGLYSPGPGVMQVVCFVGKRSVGEIWLEGAEALLLMIVESASILSSRTMRRPSEAFPVEVEPLLLGKE